MPPAPRRDDLIDTALDLFHRDGFRAVGIDRVIAETGVAKMTLYNNFESKEALMLAALRRRQDAFGAWLRKRVAELARTPRGRLLALFDGLGEWFMRRDFRGCLFIRAASEFPALADPAHRMASDHKRRFRAYIADLARDAGARDAEALAFQLAILVDGAIVAAQISGKADAAAHAKRAAAIVIKAALWKSAPKNCPRVERAKTRGPAGVPHKR